MAGRFESDLDRVLNQPWLKEIERLEAQVQNLTKTLQPYSSLAADALEKINDLTDISSLESLLSNQTITDKLIGSSVADQLKKDSQHRELEIQRSFLDIAKTAGLLPAADYSDQLDSGISKRIAELTGILTTAGQVKFDIPDYQEEVEKLLGNVPWAKLEHTTALTQASEQARQAFNSINSVVESGAFKALMSLDNSPFANHPLIKNAPAHDPMRPIDNDLEVAGSKVETLIKTETDFNALPRNVAKVLFLIFLWLLQEAASNIVQHELEQGREYLEAKVPPIATPAEARAFSRQPPQGIDPSLLSHYRIISGNNVYLREGPSRNSAILGSMPVGMLVQVVDKNHRSWLQVEVDIGGDYELGWVSRRYTTYFK